jgi:hypothetical protein
VRGPPGIQRPRQPRKQALLHLRPRRCLWLGKGENNFE